MAADDGPRHAVVAWFPAAGRPAEEFTRQRVEG
jgi:hypothetical protein